jgi:hypothetical protein
MSKTVNDIVREVAEGEGEVVSVDICRMWIEWTGEDKQEIQPFGKIPKGWEDNLENHPQDDEVFYWLTDSEWIELGEGFNAGNEWQVIRCACEECDYMREGQQDDE